MEITLRLQAREARREATATMGTTIRAFSEFKGNKITDRLVPFLFFGLS